ncbi:MAG TPA: hypothetical protein VM283_06420, partial [Armatimonadota bacterium]|nr:hypothetical protein [Armatimonadota bacterium]
ADLDVDALLDEFMRGMFSEAAPEMAAYYAHLERTWMAGNPGRTTWGHRRLPVQAYSMTVEQLDEAERLLAAAQAKATTPLVRERIAMVERGLRTGAYIIREAALSERLSTAPIADAGDAQRLIEDAKAMERLIAEREQYYAELRDGDDLPAQTLGMLDWYFKGPVPASLVEGGLATGVARALSWLQKNAPAQVAEVAAALGEGAPAEVKGVLDAWAWVAEHSPPNLLKNPGFEAGGENAEPAELDWTTAGAPPGWSTWSRYPEASRLEAVSDAAEGRLAAAISHAESAAYLQTIPVKPGERYLCSVQCRREPANGKGEVTLSVRYRAATGGWLADRSAERSVVVPAGAGGWRPLFIFAQVPEGAGGLVFMCSASGQDEDTKALFDDCAVHLVPAEAP